ncbi:MAG: DEAD/DEAH box helicase [Deltaproteobacteria bacterium]|jgi:superfamily II RNA helicase|nr:DEAD/DEAH box helicase [Deltaproteobacteria bacterium]
MPKHSRNAQHRRPKNRAGNAENQAAAVPDAPDSYLVDRRVRAHLLNIGQPHAAPFIPDPFQLEAVREIRDYDVIVSAPTGSGKTWIAQKAIEEELARGNRIWYTSPLKALSNSKFIEFGKIFGKDNVGLLTGDHKMNTGSPLIVGTTEILRNQLYDSMGKMENIGYDLVIMDEAHYLGDPDRGVVWEEILIYLPVRVRLLLLSATIENAGDMADWLAATRGRVIKVVHGGERPVPLIPLCLDDNKLMLLSSAVSRVRKKPDPIGRRGRKPQISSATGPVIKCLSEMDLLPAIFFLKSRSDCDKAVGYFNGELEESPERRALRNEFIDSYLKEHPEIESCSPFARLRETGLAAHHAGHLPYYKLLIEELMSRGLLTAIFATSTVSAGVNFPARTVVIPQSDRYDGALFQNLTPTELAQMTGRAGRRGQDLIGFALIIPGPFMDLSLMDKLFRSPPNPVRSRLNINFPMVLNLLDSMRLDDVKDLLSQSFSAWQKTEVKSQEILEQASQKLWKSFLAHVEFLKRRGLVTPDDKLTPDGQIVSKLRLEYPLVFHEALKKGALPEKPELLAATLAFLGERPRIRFSCGQKVYQPPIPSNLKEVLLTFRRRTKPIILSLKKNDFPYPHENVFQSNAVHIWAASGDFSRAYSQLGRDPGDMVRLSLLTAEILNQLAALDDFYPEISQASREAVSLLLKPPVI